MEAREGAQDPDRSPTAHTPGAAAPSGAADARRAGVLVPERAVGLAVVPAADGTVVTVVRSEDRHRLAVFARRSQRGRRAVVGV